MVTVTDINECGSNPCLNGGGCTDGTNFYTCTCLDGFMGDNCEIGLYQSLLNSFLHKYPF